MSVIWSGVTEEGAVVPVQVTEEGKVVAEFNADVDDFVEKTGSTMTGDLVFDAGGIKTGGSEIKQDGTASFTEIIHVDSKDTYISVGDIDARFENPGFQSYTDGGITLNPKEGSLVSGVYTEAGGELLSIGTNISQSGAPVVTSNVGGFVRIDARPQRAQLPGDAHCFAVKFRNENETAERRGFFVDFYNGDTWIVPDIGDVNIGDGNAFIRGDGSCEFSNGSCGFTPAGELYFTSRNTRYKLVVSNGICAAEPY